MDFHQTIDKDRLPGHIAIIMDGNGRWAKSRGAERIFGHQNAIKAVKDVAEGCAEMGVDYLTLYAFSTENWSRPKYEVNRLMELLVHTIKAEINTLQKNNIKLSALGEISSLPTKCQKKLTEAMQLTEQNSGLTLTLALSYSGRWEITDAVKKVVVAVQSGAIAAEDIDSNLFRSYLMSGYIPDPELLIRTSGEMRVSNFLLWQIAYTELYVTDKLWPDFRKNDLLEAIVSYQSRERRFGQINSH